VIQLRLYLWIGCRDLCGSEQLRQEFLGQDLLQNVPGLYLDRLEIVGPLAEIEGSVFVMQTFGMRGYLL